MHLIQLKLKCVVEMARSPANHEHCRCNECIQSTVYGLELIVKVYDG